MNPDSFERRIMNTYGININQVINQFYDEKFFSQNCRENACLFRNRLNEFQVNVTYIQWEYNKADASTIFGFDITANGVKSSGGLYQTGGKKKFPENIPRKFQGNKKYIEYFQK